MTLTEFDKKYSDKGLGFTKPINTPQPERLLLDSGSFTFNIAHGIGGIKTGGLIRIMGQPGLGKSSLSYRIMASGMSKGMSAMYIDTEGGINLNILKDTLEDYGIDPDGDIPFRFAEASNLRNVNKSTKPVMTLQRIIPMVEEFIIDDKISPKGAVVVFDSLDFMVPDEIVEGTVDQHTVALMARYMKNWLRKFSGTIRGTNSLVIVISQVSSKMDAHSPDPVEFAGGNALKHSSTLDIRLKDLGQLTIGQEFMGKKVKGMITKSKQGLSWRTFNYNIRSDVGPDRYTEVIEVGKKLGLIKGSNWLTVDIPYTKELKVNGTEALRQYYIDNPDELKIVEEGILHRIATPEDMNAVAPEAEPEERVDDEEN